MLRTVLVLTVLVGCASGWDWHSKNRNTECGYFKTYRDGWFANRAMTDVDTRQTIHDLHMLDANKDGFLTALEMVNETVIRQFDASLDIVGGIPRCSYVQFEEKRYGINRNVASFVFSMSDSNGDLRLSQADRDLSVPLEGDADGDGRVTVCEVFQGFLKVLAAAEHKVYQRDLAYGNIVWKFREDNWWRFW